jgi:hypothetical protein
MVVHAHTIIHPRTMAIAIPQTPVSHPKSTGGEEETASTHWSCLATHLWHRRQCLLRNGVRIIHVTQKLLSSNFHSRISSSMTAFCSAMPFILGTKPGSNVIDVA